MMLFAEMACDLKGALMLLEEWTRCLTGSIVPYLPSVLICLR
jgi:hypothetical protein